VVRAYRQRFIEGDTASLLPDNEAQALVELEVRIDDAIEANGFGASGCFMRLCGA
jgi:hypothetical protein